MPALSTPRRRWLRSWLGTLVLAAMVFAALTVFMRWQERHIVAAAGIDDQLDPAGLPRPIAEVSESIRAMKLVTVEIASTATATMSQESWRGDVAATVRAPVKLYYGTDLSGIEDSSITFSTALQGLVVRVPAPRRIATEVYGEAEELDVRTGWGRLRSRAGEYYLGLARARLHEAGRNMVLSPREAEEVRRTTREQVMALVRAIVGREVAVDVSFIESGDASTSPASVLVPDPTR